MMIMTYHNYQPSFYSSPLQDMGLFYCNPSNSNMSNSHPSGLGHICFILAERSLGIICDVHDKETIAKFS